MTGQRSAPAKAEPVTIFSPEWITHSKSVFRCDHSPPQNDLHIQRTAHSHPADPIRYTSCVVSRITAIIGSLREPNVCSIRLIWRDLVTEKEWASR